MQRDEVLAIIKGCVPEIVKAAQQRYDDWRQDDSGWDEDLGTGGICDQIAEDISGILADELFDVCGGGQEGDDHSFVFAGMAGHAFSVDIPCHVYELGSGYTWRKLPGVEFADEHVVICEVRHEDVWERPESKNEL
jgi:hypothetical protein